MNALPRLIARAMLLLTLSACGDGQPAKSKPVADTATTRTIAGPTGTPIRSPDSYRVRFETSKGPFVIDVKRDLAPLGSDRFHELVSIGYFTDVRFFRIVPGFIVQFGMHGDPAVHKVWEAATLPDDPIRTRNTRGTVAFAASGPNSRATQLFISTGDNRAKLDRQRLFSPFGTVVEGMDVVEKLYAEYGEEPNHARIARLGNPYLASWYPNLDYITSATVLK
ncbi:MAG TPA: peptidylprolyl isomerase [Gemmatimonas sp.]|nr:peptidylprolyl isomerase [Gemmatimonas sp.]